MISSGKNVDITLQPKSQRSVLFAEQGSTYAKLYIELLRKLQKVDTVQAVLVGIENMLSGMSSVSLAHTLCNDEEA